MKENLVSLYVCDGLIAALGCLSGIIASFPTRTMTIQEVDVMTTFYCDRMDDDVATKENIAGLSALQDMSGFGEEEVTKTCNTYVWLVLLLTLGCLMPSKCPDNFSRRDCRYIH